MACCKGCTKRELGCHSICVVYKEWKKKLAKDKQEIKDKDFTISPKSFLGTSPPPGKHRPRKK